MIDEVRAAVTALRTAPAPSGSLSVLQLRADAFVAVDDLRRAHVLLVRGDDERQVPSDLATLTIAERPLSVDGDALECVDVTCLFESVAEVFEHFVVAVLDRLAQTPRRPVAALEQTLDRWRLFLTPAGGPPSRERLASVLGELLVLRDVVRASSARDITCWIGPNESRHDFRKAEHALEVKTTRSHTSRQVRINGVDQLEPPPRGTLHVHFVRLEDVPDGPCSIAGVVDQLLSLGVDSESLFKALAASGISLVDVPATIDLGFEVLERLTFRVDDILPRIVTQSFIGGAPPVGVTDLSYAVDLDHVFGRALDDDDYSRVLLTLASDPS